MPGTIPGSQVLEFYNDAKVLITGGTGFLGKALVDKFLRVCTNVDHIYLLIRVKKGKEPHTRLKELIDDQVFSRLRKERPDFEKKVTCIPGDINAPGLGMTENDYEFLTKEVTHVFHTAATVRFNEKLSRAILINVFGTYEIVQFCHKCIRLKILAYVSTAYSYCIYNSIAEDYYEPPLTPEAALTLVKIIKEDKLTSICSDLIAPWPNTYCFTKAIGEAVIKENGKTIPVVMFRPGIVMGSLNEPEEGWVDNIYGPTGIVAAVGGGLMRVTCANPKLVANLIPVDLTINALLCSAWEGGTSWNKRVAIENSLLNSKESSDCNKKTTVLPKIYNFTAFEDNALTWHDFRANSLRAGRKTPIAQSIWYYSLTFATNMYSYYILTLLLHHLPGVIIDGLLFLTGKKPQFMKAYRKIDEFSKLMSFFSWTKLVFTTNNTTNLWSQLNEADKILFPFDVSTINWDEYSERIIRGIRLFIFKESDETLPAAKKKLFFLWMAHRLLQIILIGLALWILSKLFFMTLSVTQRPIEESIMMEPNLIRNSS